MKKITLLTSIITLSVIMFSSCGDEYFLEKDEPAKLMVIDKIKSNSDFTMEEVDNAFSYSFYENSDEFQDMTWLHHLWEPDTRYENAVYCYLGIKDNGSKRLRFVIQYHSTNVGVNTVDNPFFEGIISSAIFNIDGENFTFDLSETEGSCEAEERVFSSNYAEWYDLGAEALEEKRVFSSNYAERYDLGAEALSVPLEIPVTEAEIGSSERRLNKIRLQYPFIEKLANANTVKLRLKGDGVTKDRILSEKELKVIRDTYYYFSAMQTL